jgi:hypothetical protein
LAAVTLIVFYADCQFYLENLVSSDLRRTKLLDTATLLVLVELANVTGENEQNKIREYSEFHRCLHKLLHTAFIDVTLH